MEPVTRHLIITGRVQGVGYRFYAERKARELGLRGWVRNRRDGTVEAVIQGEPGAVETMIAWARRGPSSAQVAAMRISEGGGEYREEYSGFETRPTE